MERGVGGKKTGEGRDGGMARAGLLRELCLATRQLELAVVFDDAWVGTHVARRAGLDTLVMSCVPSP